MDSQPSQTPLLLVLAGPTASGKTTMAIRLALHFQTQIISADSRQCYQELDVGVARPSSHQLHQVPHYFIASHSIHTPVDAAGFAQYALDLLPQLFARSPLVVVTGGTGLYIQALCEGLSDIPAIPAVVRRKAKALFEEKGIVGLQQAIASADPQYYASGEILNPQRMMRALEVVWHTGRSIRHYQRGPASRLPFRVLYTALMPEKAVLHRQINQRVVQMMENGLLKEASALYPFRHLNALQTVGYRELFGYLENRCTLAQAIEDIQIHTRQYAKRQVTWLRRMVGLQLFSPEDFDGIIQVAEKALASNEPS